MVKKCQKRVFSRSFGQAQSGKLQYAAVPDPYLLIILRWCLKPLKSLCMVYPNNDFNDYVNSVYAEYKLKPTRHFVIKLIKIFPVLVWRTIKDACVELFFLMAFWAVLVKMSQGR